jgi:phospholipase/carboxylesterase
LDRTGNDEPAVVIETGADPDASVIWLHGLGADGHDFEPIVPELQLPAGLALRFIFPHAPFRPVTWNNGYVMRAWYDIAMTERGFYQNLEHLREAEQTVGAYVEAERARGIASLRIVVAGFSQGGAVALNAGLRCPHPLAGILCLSGPAPDLERLLTQADAANTATPIFLAHGEQDAVVPYVLGRRAHEALVAAGRQVEWHSYSMGHGVCGQEVADISAWLSRVLQAAK